MKKVYRNEKISGKPNIRRLTKREHTALNSVLDSVQELVSHNNGVSAYKKDCQIVYKLLSSERLRVINE